MLRVGLTGIIGCGKSLVARILHDDYDIPVIDMDLAGRAAIERQQVLRRLGNVFGPGIFAAGEILDRRALGRIVFADEGERRKLNSIVHPAMLDIVRQQMRRAGSGHYQAPYLLVDAALIFELDFDEELDLVVAVFAPVDLCLQRAAVRDGLTPVEVQQRLAAQLPQEEKCRRADYLLDNSGSETDLRRRIAEMHQWLFSAANPA